jgi:phage tail tape-measure protein
MSTFKSKIVESKDENRDPISGEPGAHPLGTGLGAAGAGAAAGAAGGAVAGPVGAAVGAVIGAVAGGLGGKAIAESIDPTAEDAYWSENYRTRPYAGKAASYDDYRPAYQQGWEARSLHSDKTWDEIEDELESSWSSRRGNSSLDWKNARHASRDAWDRIGAANRATVSDNI